jgi:hypothetical protein
VADPAPQPAPTDPTRSLRATLRGVGTVVAPTSAVTALLYYFGWTRTSVQATRLGLDESLLGYSTQDYLLRSITSMLAPLVVGFLALLAGLGLHALLTTWIQRTGGPADKSTAEPVRRRRLGRVVVGIGVGGLVLVAVGGAGTQVKQPSHELYLATPICVTLGLILLIYAANLYRRFLIRAALADAAEELQGLRVVGVGAVLMLVIASLFWNVSHYADIKGRRLASTVERQVPNQPSVIVYSEKRLYLQPPVIETRLDPTDAAYKFAYSGLKLLFRADDKFFLRPAEHLPGPNIVLPDGPGLRLEYYKA